jgi:hypothetical protein
MKREVEVEPGYEGLLRVLVMGLDQAQYGKGRERHANGEPFERQPICEGGRSFGIGCLLYQAWKKAKETVRLLTLDNGIDRAIREILGVIIYAAAAVLVLLEQKEKPQPMTAEKLKAMAEAGDPLEGISSSFSAENLTTAAWTRVTPDGRLEAVEGLVDEEALAEATRALKHVAKRSHPPR